jgi:hypothetical protein
VQITGEYRSVQNALLKVTGSLRDNLLPVEVLKEVRAKYPHMRVIEDPLRNDPVTHNVGALSPSRLQFPKVKVPHIPHPSFCSAVVISFSTFKKKICS